MLKVFQLAYLDSKSRLSIAFYVDREGWEPKSSQVDIVA
jgi:hypothetical protein